MRNRFDHIAKHIGQAALGPSGPTHANDAVTPETQYADLRHEPDPARSAARADLGLLGRLGASPCLIEAYSQAPSPEDLRACLAKHIAFWQQRARRARAEGHRRSELDPPFLWIITARAPAMLLGELAAGRAAGWPAGVYVFGGSVLRAGIVVASELPRERPTLLVRLMAAGPLLPQAIRELAALPADARERAIAEPVLLQLQHILAQDSNRTLDEQEFIMAMLKSWEEGRAEARVETQARAVLTVLGARGIAVPEAARERILTEADPARLQRWLERAAVAASLAAVLDDAP